MSNEDYDVIVVGAGLSGLTSAYTILKEKPDAKVLVLESSDHCGGPIKSLKMKVADGKEDVFDIGPSRLGSKQKELMGLIGEFGLETYPHYETGNKFWQLPDGTVKKYSGNIPPLPYTGLVDLLRYFNKVDGMQAKVKFNDVLSLGKKDEWDNMTVEEFRTKILWTQSGKDTIDVMTGLFFGLPGKYLFMTQYIYCIATAGSWNAHIGGKDSGKIDVKIKGGTQQLIDGLCDKIGKDNIKTNVKIQSIEQLAEQKVELTTTSGTQYHSKSVIMAVAPFSIHKIKFSPPFKVNRLIPAAVYGVQFVVTYHKAFWKEAGHCGEFLSMIAVIEALQEKESEDNAVLILFDHSSANGNPALMGIFGTLYIGKRSVEERKTIAINTLKKLFGDEALNVADYKDNVWEAADEIPPEEAFRETKMSETLASIRKPHGSVHFAGVHTTVSWYDTMNGAVEAGQRAAKEVVKGYLS